MIKRKYGETQRVGKRALGVRSGLLWLIMCLLTLAVSCGPRPIHTLDPKVNAEEILRQSVERLLVLEFAEFTLEHQVGTTELLSGIKMSKVYGVVDIPDKVEFTVEAEFNNTFFETSVVVIGEQAYICLLYTSDAADE